jgi:hypothetical protein
MPTADTRLRLNRLWHASIGDVSVVAEKISFHNRVVYGGTDSMKTHMGALSTLVLLAVSLPNLFAQENQPSRQEDPTAQAPATRAPLPRQPDIGSQAAVRSAGCKSLYGSKFGVTSFR